jgi:hypothetical protein
MAFRLAQLKCQRQLQASGGGKPLGGAHAVISTAAPTIDCIGKALENLPLAALNDTAVLQQLTAANLALTLLVTSFMATNKKLVDALAGNKATRRRQPRLLQWRHQLWQRLAWQPGLSRLMT